MTGGRGASRRIKTRSEPGRCHLPWKDRWRATRPSQTHSSRRKTPLVLPRKLSGERRKGRCLAQPLEPGPLPRRERQRGSPSQGAAGHSLERDREGLPTPGCCESPIGGPILAVKENIVLRPISAHHPWPQRTILQESTNTGKQEPTRTDDPLPRRGRSRCLGVCRLVRRFPFLHLPVKKGDTLGSSRRAGWTE